MDFASIINYLFSYPIEVISILITIIMTLFFIRNAKRNRTLMKEIILGLREISHMQAEEIGKLASSIAEISYPFMGKIGLNYMKFIAEGYLIILAKIRRLMNASLTKLFIETLSSTKKSEGKNSIQKAAELTILGMMVKKKSRVNFSTYVFLYLSLVFYIFTSLLFQFDISILIVAIIISLLIFQYINQKILEFRVKKGYFGIDESEIREIIQFIIENSDDPDIKNGTKEIFPTPESIEAVLKIEGAEEILI